MLRRGFSLVEMLLAVFILGIGVVSISALFPAGIALQRQANDDIMGPIVAKSAFATLRSKLSQDDFGAFGDFGIDNYYSASPREMVGTFKPQSNGSPSVLFPYGDWCWMRPGFLFGTGPNAAFSGTIDIFSAAHTRAELAIPPSLTVQKANEIPEGTVFQGPGGPSRIFGIPYNRLKYPLFVFPDEARNDPNPGFPAQRALEPLVTFTQAERAYPQGGSGLNAQYYWDCMFRRSGGRVQVAVFVYRVTAPGGLSRPYSVVATQPAGLGTPPNGAMDASTVTPPIPLVYFAPTPPGSATEAALAWPNRTAALGGTGNTQVNGYSNPPSPAEIPSTHTGTPFGVGNVLWDDWMAPGQFWIDNHGNVHKVQRGRLRANQGPIRLERPIPAMPPAAVNGYWVDLNPQTPAPELTPSRNFHAHIGAIWFIPLSDANGNVITPVYAAVEEL